MKTLVVIIFALLSFIKAESLSVQISKMKAEQISFEEGITHNSVFRIYQDSKGFIWFGSMFGLVKYDGVRYKTFRYNPNDINSLSNDDITAVFEDSEGNFWIGTYGGGLNKYIPSQNKFIRFSNSDLNVNETFDGIIWSITQDKKKNIWVVTNNAGVIKISKTKINTYSINELRLNKIFVSRANEILVGTSRGGVYSFNESKDEFTKVDLGDELNNSSILSFVEDKTNKIWIGTNKNLYSFDSNENKIVDEKIFESDLQVNDMIISDEEILIGSTNNLFIFDIRKKIIKSLSEINTSADKINLSNIISICRDNSGVIWLGSYNNGVQKLYKDYRIFTPAQINFDKTVRVNQIVEKEVNQLILATNAGLYSADSENTLSKIELISNEEIAINSIFTNGEQYFIGTDKGLLITDKVFNIIKRFSKSNSSLTDDHILKVLLDSKERLWIGNYYGVFLFDKSKNDFVNINEKYKNKILGDYVLSLFEDSEGTIWIGSYEGITKINSDDKITYLKKTITDSNSISNNYMFSFYEDEDNFWLGTGGGLNKIDKKTGEIILYDESSGLSNTVINGILQSNNKLFLSTSKGISSLDLETNIITNYDAKSELHSNMFVPGSYFRRSEGSLIFGGIDGYTSFSVANFKGITSPIEISNVEKYSNGRFFQTEENNNSYYADYRDSQIRISFALLDYNYPQAIKYRYKIPEIDTNWIYSGFNSQIDLIDLSPGEYNIIMSSTDYNGMWNDREKAVKLIISPPFWETIWFLILISLLTVILLILSFILYHKRKIKRLLLIQKIRDEEEKKLRKKAADDFHDELGHRITKISLYSELLKRASIEQESGTKDYLKKISELSSSLSFGVKDFIWTLDPNKDSYYDVALRIKDFGEEFFSKTGINFRVNGINQNFEKIQIPMDYKRNMIFIFKEAMNNSLKYSGSQNVSLKFNFVENRISIELEDDGVGIEENKFNFGRGLKNMNNRAKIINGKLVVDSSLNKGTKIFFEACLN